MVERCGQIQLGRMLLFAAVVSVSLAAIACETTAPGVRIRENQFVRHVPEGPIDPPWAMPTTEPVRLNSSMGFDPALGEVGVLEIAAVPGPPKVRQESAPLSAPVLIDAKVGEINGTPIYASEFFADMAARLRAEAQRMDRSAWLRSLDEQIRVKLAQMVKGVLLVAEARASLTPVQRQGLAHFVRRVAEDIQSANYGSRTLADERLSESQGLTLDEMVRLEEERILIGHGLMTVRNRVRVSDTDVRREYQRQQSRFNPPPVARVWVIRVPNTDKEGLDEVRTALDAGTPFVDVAQRPVNRSFAGGLQELTFTGDYKQANLFTSASLNDAARSLLPGAWAGPVQITGDTSAWIYLEEIRRTSIPYYEAQATLREELWWRRYQEEETRYLSQLMRGANEMDVEDIVLRLKQYAIEHFLPR